MLNFIAIMLWSVFIIALLAWTMRVTIRGSLVYSIPIGLMFWGIYCALS